MRKIAAAVLALPVLAAIYAVTIWQRPRALRATLVGGVVMVTLAAALVLITRPTSALPVETPAPVAAEQFGPDVSSVEALADAVEVSFSQPMDSTSVEAALSVTPPTPVHVSWVEPGRRLRIVPSGAWTPATYFTVTVGTSAHTATGAAIAAPVIKGFYTRSQTTAQVAAVVTDADGLVSLKDGFVVDFDRPVQATSARSAFRISPKVAGTLTVTTNDRGGTRLTFVPTKGLKANTVYTVSLAGTVYDADGAAVAEPAPFEVRSAAAPVVAKAPKPTRKPTATTTKTTKPAAKPPTVTKPPVKAPAVAAVVRFRPLAGTQKVAADANISVRFTKEMDRARTQAAFSITIKGHKVAGTYSWFEGNTVLLLDPKANLTAGATVSMRVSAAARAADGARLARAVTATFTVAPGSRPIKPTPPPSGGGGGGGGAWAAVERYYLKLMNCTRGGGWVTSNGSCSSPGGRGIAPLWIDAGISAKVSRPYAKLLATTGVCSHFYRGNPGTRLHAAGYTSYRWAENLGCRSARTPYASVLGTHQYFQSERSWRPQGGHWVNLMNRAYDRVGLGVWVYHGRVRLVIDFYHP